MYSDGRFVMGNSTTNIVFNGSSAYLNGFNVTASGSVTSVNFLTSTKVALITFTISKTGIVQYSAGGNLNLSSTSALFDSIIVDMKFQLEDSSGLVYDSAYGGGSSRTAYVAGGRWFSENLAFTNTKTLGPNTYTLYAIKNNLFIADSTGGLSTPTLSTYELTYAYSNYHAIFI